MNYPDHNEQAGRMTILARFSLLLLLAFSSIFAFAQATDDNFDRIYGFDPLLYNGRVYSFFPQPGTGGTQFLFDSFDTLGSVRLRGIDYSNLTLNYDIYNQQLVMKYLNNTGSTNLIEISEAWLDMFVLGGCHFETVKAADTTKRIYQVLGNGAEKILYYRSKELLIDNLKTSAIHYFSQTNREMYVLANDCLLKYRNNKGFVAAFDPSKREEIKKRLRKQKIKVRRANDFIMNELINYCNTLYRK